jgi:Arc/MetJ family transcription regulator
MLDNIEIDEKLLEEAIRFSGFSTKQAVIEEALRLFVRLKSQEQIRALRGKVQWEGDLDTMREGRNIDSDINLSRFSQESE